MVLGAYDCLETRLYFDPFQAPFNLGAVIAHELDHLYRDKLTFGKGWPLSLARVQSIEDLEILDEVAATLMSALVQYRYYRDSNRDFAFERARGYAFKFFHHGYPVFRNLNFNRLDISPEIDLSLFDRKGRINKIWENFFQKLESKWTAIEIKGARDRERYMDSLRKQSNDIELQVTEEANQRFPKPKGGIEVFGRLDEIYSALDIPEALPLIAEIIQIVSREYAPNRPIDSPKLAETLVTWLRVRGANDELSPLRAILSDRITEDAANIDDLLGKPSDGCNAMVDKIHHDRGGVRPAKLIRACKWPEEKI